MFAVARPISCSGRSASPTTFPSPPDARSMLTLLAAAVLAQSSVSLQVGKDKQDSIARAKSDSIAYHREQRRDSLRAHRQFRDSVQQQARIRRQIPITPAVLATAFKDAPAKDLLLRARAARLAQDSALIGYDANSYERMSGGMGFKKIGRDRLLMRGERASHVMWQRDKGAIVDVTGQRSVFPMLDGVGKGDIDISAEAGCIPYRPGPRTTLLPPYSC